MLGNIWLSSALIVTAIFSASAMYKSYSDIQEAKQIQENYEIISEIKTLLAIQYNKNPQKITRDEIIAYLPSGGNWEKVLLLDRQKDSTLTNKELLVENGKMEISEDEKLKLLALKAKLKNITDVNAITAEDGKYTFEVGENNKNVVFKDKDIEDSINRAIHFLGVELLYSGKTELETVATLKNNFIPYNEMYQDFRKIGETSDLDEEVLNKRKKAYFIKRIIDKLYLNETVIETKLYSNEDLIKELEKEL